MTRKWLAVLTAFMMLFALAASAAAETGKGGELPVEWDLDSIYASVDEWQADYDKVMDMLDRYEERLTASIGRLLTETNIEANSGDYIKVVNKETK